MTTDFPRLVSLCSGYGGLDLAVAAAFGAVPVAHAEIDRDAARVLAAHWPDTPNLGDITAVSPGEWAGVGPVDVVAAGYPCQPESAAGRRRGAADPRWIWPGVACAIDAARPAWVVLENVVGHVSGTFSRVLADLARLGYDARWTVTRASDIGAAHRRARLFILACPAAAPAPGCAGIMRADDGLFGPVPWSGPLPRSGVMASARIRPVPAQPGTAPGGGAAVLLPTPRASEQENRQTRISPSQAGGRHGRSLAAEVCTLLPTPRATDGTHGGPGMRGSSGDVALPSAVIGTWGRYAAAVTRHATVSGRPAPEPTEPGGKTGRRLAPRFVEWLMMLPDGWVTATSGITRNAALRLLGNGVVPAQASNALAVLAAAVPAAPSADTAGRR